jgi:hypothetical protein
MLYTFRFIDEAGTVLIEVVTDEGLQYHRKIDAGIQSLTKITRGFSAYVLPYI